MSRTRAWWDELVSRASPPAVESPPFEDVAVRTGRDRAVDALVCLLGAVAGALFLSPELDEAGRILTTSDVLLDAGCGLPACGYPPLSSSASTARPPTRSRYSR